MLELIGKKVEVISLDIVYKGVLVEIGETDVYLLSDNGWVVIPADRVAEIRAAE